jgi:hypothetical protein
VGHVEVFDLMRQKWADFDSPSYTFWCTCLCVIVGSWAKNWR